MVSKVSEREVKMTGTFVPVKIQPFFTFTICTIALYTRLPAWISGKRRISASPWIFLSVAPLCFAASGSMARSKERGPSTIQPVIFPYSFIFVSSAASTVTGILGFTTSTAARGATLGHSTPQALATGRVLLIMFTLSSNVG